MNPLLKRTLLAIATGIASTFSGLIIFLILGVVTGAVQYGVIGILLAMFIGGATGTALKRHTALPSSTIAGAVGAMISSYAALSMGEAFDIGTLEWGIKGGAYAAIVGIIIGGFLGILGLIRR